MSGCACGCGVPTKARFLPGHFSCTAIHRKQLAEWEPWTYQEKRRLILMRKDGDTIKDIARRLGRSFKSTELQIRHLLRDGKLKRKAAGRPKLRPPILGDGRVGANICPVCRGTIHNGTDGNGVALMWCGCQGGALRYVPLIRPSSFQRYQATEQRLKELAGAVARQIRPVGSESAA